MQQSNQYVFFEKLFCEYTNTNVCMIGATGSAKRDLFILRLVDSMDV